MRRRIHPVRDANSGHSDAASPGLRAVLLWISIVALFFVFGCAAQAQSSGAQSANSGTHSASAKAAALARTRAANNFARVPLSFEENRGQTDAQVKFLSRGPGYTLFLTGQEAVLAFPRARGRTGKQPVRPAALHLRFDHANPRAQITGREMLPGRTNYFPTGDRSTWHTGIANYSAVEYREIYPGVDMVFHGNPQRLEFDFDVAPGADPEKIDLDVAGGRVVRLNRDGDIVLGMGRTGHDGEITLGKPSMYQEIAGVRHEIPSKFVLHGRHHVGFELGAYDRAQALTIDPTLSYSTYLGAGTGNAVPSSDGLAVAVDSLGNAYVVGGTNSTDFPTPGGGTGGSGAPQAFVAKFGADGTLLYTSFLQEYITVWGIAVDASGSAYVGGAADFGVEVTPGAYAGPTGGYTGSILGVIKLSPDGSTLAYAAEIGSAYPSNENLGGMGIAVDSSGSAYVAASTNLISFPTTTGGYQSSCWSTGCTTEATVTKLSPDGSSLVYSTLLGGHGGDYGTGIAVDASGDAFVTGATGSTDFPTTTGVLQPACSSSNSYANQPPSCADTDIFVTELNPTGSSLVYSTYLGNGINLSNGADSQVGIAVDAAGNAYVSASTDSTVFTNGIAAGAGPTIMGPPMNCNSGYTVCSTGTYPDYYAGFNFLAKIAPGGGTLAYLGFLGGYSPDAVGEVNGYTWGDSVAVDSAGNAYLTGTTQSSFFPTTSDALLGSFQEDYSYLGTDRFCTTSACGSEAYFSILNTGVSGIASLTYSTYLGAAILDENPTYGTGIAVDTNGNAWLTGVTMSSTFPTTPNALQLSCTLANSSPPYCDDYAFVTEFATATTTAAAAIAPVSGGGQSAAIGTAFANPLVVKVTDANNDPVSGAVVTFTAPSSGASASLSSTTGTTASDGTANVTATANGIASSTAYQVSASVAGVTTPATFSLTNTPAATTLTVTPSALSLVYGQPVTINAAISPANIDGSVPTGSVTFYDGTTALTPNSTVSGAAATYTVNVPTVGSHPYAAQYSGDSNFQESALTSTAAAVVVGKASVTLTGPATQPVTVSGGQAGSIAITVTGQYSGSGIATPSGSVSYSVSGNGFASGTAPISNGSATIPVPDTVAAGSYTVTVSYAGDSNYSAATTITVLLTVTATVQPAAVTDNETITVSDAPQVVLGMVASDNEAISVVDTVSVQASGYLSDAEAITVSDAPQVILGMVASDNEAISVVDNVSVRAEQTPTTTTLLASANVSPEGYNVTFTATVTASGGGTPAGTVTFYDGTTALGTVTLSGGQASYTTSSLPPGNLFITAVYSGNGGFVGSSSPGISESITSFDLNFTGVPIGGITVYPAQTVSFTFTVTPSNGPYDEPVSFSISGLPTGATAVFNPNPATPGSSPVDVTLTITIPPLSAQRQPPAIFRDSGPALLAMLLPAAAFYRKRRKLRSILLALVAVCALGTLAGLSGCGGSGFFNQPPQTYTATVSGASGTATRSANLNLTVE